MGLYQRIKQRWTSSTGLPEIADEIADRCVDAVWQRVRHDIVSLTPAEARGYIRARCVAIVQPQIQLASVRHEVLDRDRPLLHALSVATVIFRIQARVRENAGRLRWRTAA